MPAAPKEEIRIRRRPDRLGMLALIFVLLSLGASVLAPVILQQRIDRIRAEVDGGIDPARTLVTGIQFALAREMSALRGYLITGDALFIATYTDANRREDEAYRRLEPIARGVGGEVLERFVVLRTLSEQWHQEVTTDEILRDRQLSPTALARIPMEQELYEDALNAARDLDGALVRAAQQRAQAIREIERYRLIVTGALVLLAALSSIVVVWLSRQVNRLAVEAERQRVTAVRALAEAQRTLTSRYRLMRGVTHDIKNPLGAADGYGELLQMGLHGRLGPEQTHAVARIRGCIADALTIIHDLLELSRAETGSLPVDKRQTDVAALLRGVADEYDAAAGAAGRRIRVDDGGEVAVTTDPARVRQILGNLISNAIKYAHGSERIVLSASRAPAAARRGEWIAVRVTDFGPGIPPRDLACLFDEFYRVESDAGAEGHGLGLSVSRRIAKLLGGDLTAESELGRGSIFTLWLPVGDTRHRPANAGPSNEMTLATPS